MKKWPIYSDFSILSHNSGNFGQNEKQVLFSEGATSGTEPSSFPESSMVMCKNVVYQWSAPEHCPTIPLQAHCARCARATPATGGRRGTGPGARGAAGGRRRGVATLFYLHIYYLPNYLHIYCLCIYLHLSPGLRGAGAGRAVGRGGGTPRPPPPWQAGSRGRPTPGAVHNIGSCYLYITYIFPRHCRLI